MEQQSPGKRFLAASEAAVCPYMKKITLEKVALSLERMAPRVTVDPDDRGTGARRDRPHARDHPEHRRTGDLRGLSRAERPGG